MNGNIFKSTVYHLFHGHETVRDKTRFPIVQKHKTYTKGQWLDHIKRHSDWGTPLPKTIDGVEGRIMEETPSSIDDVKITICIVNFLRYDILIKSLTHLSTLNVPINLILWINEISNIPNDKMVQITDICKSFTNYDIMGSHENMGTGYPRFMMMNKAYYEYDTDYIMTADDDIIYENPESLTMGSVMLNDEKYKDYGAIGLWCHPQHKAITIVNNEIKKTSSVEGFHDVDLLGAATMTIRREILDKCNYDPLYKIGLVDWDFSMSIKSNGYKLGLLCDDRYKPINDIGENTSDYNNERCKSSVINDSKKRFLTKWGIKV